MTYQSSPYYPIIFPDQAARLNMYGYQDPKPNHFSHAKLEPAGHDAHVSWKDQADRMVYAKVSNTKSADRSMLKGPHSMKGKHSYTTKRHSFVGGNLPEGYSTYYDYENADYTFENPLSGGFKNTVYGVTWEIAPGPIPDPQFIPQLVDALRATKYNSAAYMSASRALANYLGTPQFSLNPPLKKGGSRPASIQPQIDALLKDRTGQYDAVNIAGFEAVSPERLYVPVPKVESFGVDTLFTTLFQYVDLGDLKNALKQTTIITNTLLSSADKLEKDSFDTYLGVIRQCILIAKGIDNQTDIEHASVDPQFKNKPKSYVETKKMLKALEKELEGIGEFLLKFIQYSNKPTAQRASLLANIRKSMLSNTLKNPQTIVSGSIPSMMSP